MTQPILSVFNAILAALSISDGIQLAIAIPAVATFVSGLVWGLFKLVQIFNKISEVLAEVKPNGGNSLKDRVVKLEGSHARLEASQRDQTSRLHRIETKLDRQTA